MQHKGERSSVDVLLASNDNENDEQLRKIIAENAQLQRKIEELQTSIINNNHSTSNSPITKRRSSSLYEKGVNCNKRSSRYSNASHYPSNADESVWPAYSATGAWPVSSSSASRMDALVQSSFKTQLETAGKRVCVVTNAQIAEQVEPACSLEICQGEVLELVTEASSTPSVDNNGSVSAVSWQVRNADGEIGFIASSALTELLLRQPAPNNNKTATTGVNRLMSTSSEEPERL